ncbi:hypothetical protein D3C72_2058880 [compost metagenome]
MTSVPPRSEVASPSELTVASMRLPGLEKGGSVAVTMTAATFLALDWPPCVEMPRFCSMARIDWSVKGEERRLSPEPCRPTIRP